MDLSKILAISGKPGLFELVGQSKNNSVVQDLISLKKTTISARYKVSILGNITVFTTDEDVSLEEILGTINKKENGKPCISHKEDPEDLRLYFESVLPNFDKSKVYLSDIKKIVQWYNIFQEAGRLDDEKEVAKTEKQPKEIAPKEKTAKKVETKAKKVEPKKDESKSNKS